VQIVSVWSLPLWPRLKRDDRTWLPLPIIRPERAVISGTYGLAQALQQVVSEAQFADGVRQRGLPRSRARPSAPMASAL
jgi:hypothetical protein